MKIHELLTENTKEPNQDNQPMGRLEKNPSLDRNPNLEAAAQKVHDGEMTSRDFWKLVGELKPVTAYKELPKSASPTELTHALQGKTQKQKVNATIPEGELVHLRLDIPAYTKHGVWAPTIHSANKSGNINNSISHRPTAIVNNVSMHVEHTDSIEKKGNPLHIARGARGKFPLATITGNWENATTEDAREQAQAALNDPEWIQVGMDPRRHSYFYNRANRRPVISGSRAIQIGGLVLLKGPIKYGKRSDYIYEYIQETLKQIDQEIIDTLFEVGNGSTFQLGPKGLNNPDDCVDASDPSCPGHRAGAAWQAKHPNEPLKYDPSHPSFTNGREQQTNMIKKSYKTISNGVRRNGRFVSVGKA